MGVASIPESAAALVAHVDDPEVAAWLLRQAKLNGPLTLRATITGAEALRHLKGDVHRATTAAMACEDPDALDRFARDPRVTLKRTVAARPVLHDETVERLWHYAHKHDDAEIVSGLIDKVSLATLSEQLFSETPTRTASLLSQMPYDRVDVFASRLVASGDWELFLRAAAMTRRHGDGFARALGSRPVTAPGLEFSDPASPLNDPEARHGVRLTLEALLRAVTHWDRARADWAVKLFTLQFDPSISQPSYSVSSYSTYRSASEPRDEVVVDDDAAPLLVSLLERDAAGLSQLHSRHSERGALAGLIRREATAAVASSPKQAARHFTALSVTTDTEVASTLLWRASEDRRSFSVERERAMVELATRLELVNSSASIPMKLGRRVETETVLELLRTGELGITLEWLSGRRFCPPTIDAVAALVSDPGKAFHSSRYSSRFNSWARDWWAHVPSPGSWRGQSASAAGWFIDMQEWLSDPLGPPESAEIAYLRSVVTPEMVVAAVDAAGSSGVASALDRPGWLVGRISQMVGFSLEVWETLVGLAPEWDQSLSELISTAALLSGVPLLEQPEPVIDEAPSGTLTQLSLL